MNGILDRRRLAGVAATASLLLGFAGVRITRADNLVTASGTVYHDAVPQYADPDGVTYAYDEGMCKIDFTDLPESVRKAYHYDPAKAAAYRDAQAKEYRQAQEQKVQMLEENVERARAQLQARTSAAMSRVSGGAEIAYRRSLSPAASEATKALGAEVAAAVGKSEKSTAPATPTLTELHKIESTLTSLGIIHFSHPAEITNANEFKTDLHHSPGGFDETGAQDAFSTPIYLTKSYNEDVDRADAFATGVPLKP